MEQDEQRILLVEDSETARSFYEHAISGAGYAVTSAENPIIAKKILADQDFAMVITDVRLPGQDGLSFLQDIREDHPDLPVILITAYGSVDSASAAYQEGANNFLEKPISADELALEIDKAISSAEQKKPDTDEQSSPAKSTSGRIIGDSNVMAELRGRMHQIANTNATVIIQGETGTGKELVARTLHDISPQSDEAFVPVSCAALPRPLLEAELFGYEEGAFTGAREQRIGRIERADGGTLFLDDADDIPLAVQVKLLRVLQEREVQRIGAEESKRVNIRVISSTKQDLYNMVEKGDFREDLFFRLSVVPLYVPPLRERKEDVPDLVKYFLEQAAVQQNRDKLDVAPETFDKLKKHDWPGNVRELEHTVHRMVALSETDTLKPEDVPDFPSTDESEELFSLDLNHKEEVDMEQLTSRVEMKLIDWARQKSNGNLSEAARRLGIPRSTLQYKMEKEEGAQDGE